MREKRQTFPEHSQQTKQSCLSQLKPNIVLIETGNAPDAGLSPEPESELMPAGSGVNAPASGPAPTELQSWPQPTPTIWALGPVIWQLSDGTTRHNGRSGPQESDGGGTEKINPDRRSDPQVQTSPGPPPSALEKAHQAHNSERRGGHSAEQPELSDWQPPGGRKPAFSLHVGGCDSRSYSQEEQWNSNGVPIRHESPCTDLLLGEMHRPLPTTMPTPGPPSLKSSLQLCGQEDLVSPQEDPNDDTHKRAGFFKNRFLWQVYMLSSL